MSKKINIAIIQTSIKWEDTKGNLSNYDQIINSINPGVDIIFFPEMFNTGFSMNVEKIAESMDGLTVSWLRNCALTKNVCVVATLAVKENKNFYNRLVWVYPNGKITSYDKRHTFTLAGESKVYSKGNAKTIIDYKGWKFLPQVCYDLRFPVWSRNDSACFRCSVPSSRLPVVTPLKAVCRRQNDPTPSSGSRAGWIPLKGLT